jgi:hypothetical protein
MTRSSSGTLCSTLKVGVVTRFTMEERYRSLLLHIASHWGRGACSGVGSVAIESREAFAAFIAIHSLGKMTCRARGTARISRGGALVRDGETGRTLLAFLAQ